jgi:ABC-type molybdate transport system substrate-binding protein
VTTVVLLTGATFRATVGQAATLTIAAAADLRKAFDEIGKQFQQFVMSGTGKTILRRYGFLIPGDRVVP